MSEIESLFDDRAVRSTDDLTLKEFSELCDQDQLCERCERAYGVVLWLNQMLVCKVCWRELLDTTPPG